MAKKNITKALLGGKLMFPTEFVAAVEFGGRDVTLTIASVQIEGLVKQGSKKENKPVLSFKETKKRLVLNKTNAGTIADLYGTKAEEWPGHKVTLYPTTCDSFGEQSSCIRVRARIPGSATPPPPAAVLQDPEPREEPEEPDAFAEQAAAAPEPAANGQTRPPKPRAVYDPKTQQITPESENAQMVWEEAYGTGH